MTLLLDPPTGAVIRHQRRVVNGKISSFADSAWERKAKFCLICAEFSFFFCIPHLVFLTLFRNQLWGITLEVMETMQGFFWKIVILHPFL